MRLDAVYKNQLFAIASFLQPEILEACPQN
jgi:hypothetical protein